MTSDEAASPGPRSTRGPANDDAGRDELSRDWQEFRRLMALKHADDALGRGDALRSTEAIYSAIRLVTRFQNDFELLHRPHGLTWAGFRVLNVIWVAGPSEVRDVARHLGVARPSVSSAISTLEQAGIVSRQRLDSDRRLVVVDLTDRGREILHEAIERQADRQLAWMNVLSEHDQQAMVDILNRLLDQPRLPTPR